MPWLQPQTLSAAEPQSKTNTPASLSDYHLADADLKIVRIDSDPIESFLSLQLDSAGRLFAGAREALFVYEPVTDGLYGPRQLLYRFPKDSWTYGIAIRGTDLYVSTHTAVYVLEGAVLKRTGLRPKRLLWGMPMLPYFEEHQGMHGLIFGPEGDLYVSLGDNLVGYGDFKRADHWGHWTFFHGHHATPLTTAGAVVRISPDGESFTPIARGLRNCCGLAFDANWNLFGNDNDHESIPNEYVPGRLVQVTPHAFFSWPRGWLIQKQPWRGDLLDTLNPDLGRYVPTGQAYYDEAFLPERFRHNLLVAEWGKGFLARYPLRNQGASFTAAQVPLLSCANNVRPVGVAVGRGGRIFLSLLVMAGNEASPVCRSEIMIITRSDDPSAAPFSAYEETATPAEKLFGELEDPSWQRRYRAHVELMRRGKSIQADAVSRLKSAPAGSPLQSSLIWLAAAGGETQPLKALAASPNDITRLTAIRALTQSGRHGEDCRLFEQALVDPNPQVALAALVGVFDRCTTFPQGRVLALATNADSFLRQTAVQLLAEKAPLVELQQLSESARPESRFAGVLALGFRLTVPRATNSLSAEFPLNARGFSARVQYADGLEDLAARGRLGVFTIADVWAHGTRNQEAETAFVLLQRRLNDADQRVAKQAAFFARLLKDQRTDAMVSAILGTPPDPQTNSSIANARSTGATELPVEFRSLDWEKEAARGDSNKGAALFTARGCAVCHSVRPDDKGAGGPSLAGAGIRFNVTYLVESVIVPNKTVAPMFRWTLLRLKDGDDVAGLITGETADEIQLLLPAGVRRVVSKNEVAKREIQERSPMPEGLIQTPAELRDLLAFLLAQK